MTNEEAIKMLTEVWNYLIAGNPVWDADEAMTMAIEALKVSEIPTGSDLISRQDAISLVDRPIVPTGDAVYDNAKEDERESIKDELLSLPSKDKPTGEWTDDMKCTNCGFQDDDFGIKQVMKCTFCPNCGARMEIK